MQTHQHSWRPNAQKIEIVNENYRGELKETNTGDLLQKPTNTPGGQTHKKEIVNEKYREELKETNTGDLL